jgi:hypothetical protein
VKNNPAIFIGLEFSRPLGKNNGSSNGVVYFECPENHGLFVKEDAVVLVKRAVKGGTPVSAALTPVAEAAPIQATTPAATPVKTEPVAVEEVVKEQEKVVVPVPYVASLLDDQVQRRITLLETQLEELKLEKEELMLDKEDADAKLADLDVLKAKVAELAGFKERVSVLEAENAKLASAAPVSAVTLSNPTDNAQLKEEVDALSAAIQVKEAELKAERERAHTSETKVAELVTQMSAKEGALAAQLVQVEAQHQASRDEAKAASDAWKKRELDLNALVTEKQESLDNAKKALDEMSSRLTGDVAAQNNAWKEREAAMNSKLEAKLAELEQVKVASANKEAELAADLKSRLADANAKLAEASALAASSETNVAAEFRAKLLAKEAETSAKLAELSAASLAREKQLEGVNKTRAEELEKRSAEALRVVEERLADKENKIVHLNAMNEELGARAAKAELAVQERDRKLQEQVTAFEGEKLRMKEEVNSANSQLQSLRLAAESQAGNKQLMETFQKEELRLKEHLQTALSENQRLLAQMSQLKTESDQAVSAFKLQLEEHAKKTATQIEVAAIEARDLTSKHVQEKQKLSDELVAEKSAKDQLSTQMADLAVQIQNAKEEAQKRQEESVAALAQAAESAKTSLAHSKQSLEESSRTALAELQQKHDAASAAEKVRIASEHEREMLLLREQLSAAKDAAEAQVAQLQQSFKLSDEKTKANSETVSKQFEALQSDLASKNALVESLTAKFDSAGAALDAAKKEHLASVELLKKEASESLNALKGEHDAQMKQLTESLAIAKKEHESSIEGLKKQVLVEQQTHAVEVEKLKSSLTAGAASVGETLQRELATANAQTNAAKQSLQLLQQELGQERAKYASLAADAASHETKVSQTEAMLNQARSEFVEAQKAWLAEKEDVRTRDAARVAQAEEAVGKNKTARVQLQQAKDEAAKVREEARQAIKVAKEEHAKELSEARKQVEEALSKVRAELQEEQGEDDLKEALEMATLDKELLEERLEETASKVVNMEKELEELRSERNARALAAQSVDAASLPEGARLVQEQNAKLVVALQKMKQVMDEKQVKLTEQMKMLKEENEMVPLLEESVSSLEKELSLAKEREAELKEALEERSGMDEMVEKLSDEKMTLQEKLANAEAALLDMEELHEMSKEIEENQRAEETKLRGLLKAKEIQIADLNSRIINMQNQSNEAAATILKFRARMAALSADMEEQKAREAQLAARERELEDLSRSLRQHNIVLQASVDQDRSAKLQSELSKIRSQQSDERLKMTLSLLPDGFFRGDLDAVVLLLAVRRVKEESLLLAAEVVERGLFKDEPLYQVSIEDVLANLAFCCTSIGVALEEGDQDHVDTSAVVPLVSALQTMVGMLLDDVQAGKLTVSTDLSQMKAAVAKLRQFVVELHPDAPRPSPQVQVMHDLNYASRLCNHASLMLAGCAGAPRRVVERWHSAAVASSASIQYLNRSAATAYPDAFRMGMEEHLAAASVMVESLKTCEDWTAEKWNDFEQKLILFVETVNKLHDEAITGGLMVPEAAFKQARPASGLAGWQLRVARVRDEIVRLLDLEALLSSAQAQVEAEKAVVESKEKELMETSRQVVMLTKKIATLTRKEEVLRNQLALKDTEIEQLRLMEAALQTTQKEMTAMEQEKRVLQMQLQELSRNQSVSSVDGGGGPVTLGSGIPVQVFDREIHRYKDALAFLSNRLSEMEGREMQSKSASLALTSLRSQQELPQKVLATREEVAAERMRLRIAAATARVVDVTERTKKTVWLEQQRCDKSKVEKLTAKCSEALAVLGDGRVSWSLEGKELLAKVRPGGVDESKAKIVKVCAHQVTAMLVVK